MLAHIGLSIKAAFFINMVSGVKRFQTFDLGLEVFGKSIIGFSHMSPLRIPAAGR